MGLNGPVPPQQAQGISGTAAGVNPTLPTVVTIQGDPAGIPVPVSGSFTPPALQDVNLTEVGGVPVTSPLPVDVGFTIPNPLPIDGGNPTPVDVIGTVAVTGIPNPLPVSQSGAWTVAATQGTNPWVVSGTVSVTGFANPLPVSQSGSWTVTANQGTSPWVVSSAQLPAALVGGRLDANIGAWLGSTAPTVGQKASASSLPVVIASDQSGLPVNIFPGTAPSSGQVTVTNTATDIVAADSTRRYVTIVNRQNVPIWVGPATVTTGNGIRLDPGDSLTILSTAKIQGITAAAYTAASDDKAQYFAVAA